jgi:hypothetical protein
VKDTARRFRTTVRLDEAVIGLAERAAAELDTTVPALIEALLLEYLHRPTTGTRPAFAGSRPSGDIIDLDDARRRRRGA